MLSVKYVPSWFPGAGFQKRIRVTHDYIAALKNVPYERVKAERVCDVLLHLVHGDILNCYRKLVL